jgi:aspartate/methionine/tyrosine aminotransferase
MKIQKLQMEDWLADHQSVQYNQAKDNGFLPEPGNIRELITPKTKLIIINNPHNPTGSVLDRAEIPEIGKVAQENDVYLLFDEHYKFLPLEAGTWQLTSGFDICREIHHKVAAVGSVTKSFYLKFCSPINYRAFSGYNYFLSATIYFFSDSV